MMILELPFPPSTNTYWRHIAVGRSHRTLISAKGLQFRRQVAEQVMVQKQRRYMDMPLRAIVELWPPDNRNRDLDNFAGKALYDAMENAGVYVNDHQIRESHNYWREIVRGGRCVVTLEQL